MSRKRRVGAAIALLIACTPGNILYSEVRSEPPETVGLTLVAGASETGATGWEVAGVWEFSGEGLLFGGFSALVALPDYRLMAFSDRGARFTFDEPDSDGSCREVVHQSLVPERLRDVPDIESAAYDPATGTYWLAFENDHSIDRFTADHSPAGLRDIDETASRLNWSNNSGAEAFTRLADGRFVILPEGKRTGLIYPSDPVEGADHAQFGYLPPVRGHGATDMAQLPDGRVLLLLRNLDPLGGIPPFASKIAIGPAPVAGEEQAWAPQITIDLAGVVPRENYEGIAIRPLADGRVAVWLVSDDNLSIMQRTLVVKLILDPAMLENKPDKAKGARK